MAKKSDTDTDADADADTGLVDHSADEPVNPADDAPAEQPNPMAHWLMIVDNIIAGFRHMAMVSPAHQPLAGFARLIEADLAAIRRYL